MAIPILQTIYKFKTPPELELADYNSLKLELDKDNNFLEKNKQNFYDLNSTGINLCLVGILFAVIGLSIQQEGILVAISGFSIMGVLFYSVIYLIPESIIWAKASVKRDSYIKKLKTDILDSHSFEDFKNIRSGKQRIKEKKNEPNSKLNDEWGIKFKKNDHIPQTQNGDFGQHIYKIEDVYNNLIELKKELNNLYIAERMDSDFFQMKYSSFAFLSFLDVFQNINASDKLYDQVTYFRRNYLNPTLLRYPINFQSNHQFILRKKKLLLEQFKNESIIKDSKNKELSFQMTGTIFIDRSSEIKKKIAMLEYEGIILEYIIYNLENQNDR